MATWTKGVIIWQGDAGKPEAHLSKGLFREITDAAALDTFATAMLAHTDCNVYSKHFNSITETGDAAPGASANVDVKGMVVVKDSADGSIHKFMIPAPAAADYELVGQGTRMTALAISTSVGLLNTATGKTYVGLYGKKIQRG